MLSRLRWPAVLLIVAGLIAALVWLRPTGGEAVVDRQERQAIASADSGRRVFDVALPRARKKTDRALADTSATRQEVKVAVVEERAVADSSIAAADRQVAARDRRITTLEKRNGGILFVYSEIGVTSPLDRLKAGFEGEAGLELRLDRNTRIQLGATSDKEVQVKVRRDFRLF